MEPKTPTGKNTKSGERRLLRVGGKSYSISLPIEWIRKYHVDEQDRLAYHISNEGKLSFLPASLPKRDDVIVISNVVKETNADSLLREVIAAYLWGYNTIKVTSKAGLTPKQRETVWHYIKRRIALGCRITDISEGMIISVDVNYEKYPVLACLRDMGDQTLFMSKEAFGPLAGRSLFDDDYMRDLDDHVDGKYIYLVRLLKACADDENLMASMDLELGRDCLGARIIGRHIERIADHTKAIGDALNKLKDKDKCPASLATDLSNFGTNAYGSFQKVMDAYFSSNYDAADEQIHQIDTNFMSLGKSEPKGAVETAGDIIEAIKKAKLEIDDTFSIASIVLRILRVAQNCKGIGQIVLNLNFKRRLQKGLLSIG